MVSDAFVTRQVHWQEGASAINDCEYLFAVVVREISESTLGLVIVEAKAQAEIANVDGNGAVDFLRLGARPVEEDRTCKAFEVLFESNSLISYTVLNESYGSYPKPPEQFSGNLFRVFSYSHLLEFTKQHTYAGTLHPDKLQHYEIVCQNHVFDVISTNPPRIAVGKRRV